MSKLFLLEMVVVESSCPKYHDTARPSLGDAQFSPTFFIIICCLCLRQNMHRLKSQFQQPYFPVQQASMKEVEAAWPKPVPQNTHRQYHASFDSLLSRAGLGHLGKAFFVTPPLED